jgi:hypothetical protein
MAAAAVGGRSTSIAPNDGTTTLTGQAIKACQTTPRERQLASAPN